jgi:Mrr N-terminal domain
MESQDRNTTTPCICPLGLEMEMPLRQIKLLCGAVVEFLKNGSRPAWEIEDELARQFRVTEKEGDICQSSGCPVWRNDVAWALKQLVERGGIILEGSKKAPDGGRCGLYRLSY